MDTIKIQFYIWQRKSLYLYDKPKLGHDDIKFYN